MIGVPSNRRAGRRGFILICVLWIMAILTVLTVGFGQRAYLDARAAALTVDTVQARHMARGAVHRGIAELRQQERVQKILRAAAIDMNQNQGGGGGRLKLRESVYGTYETTEIYGDLFEGAYENDTSGVVVADVERRFNVNALPAQIIEQLEAMGYRGLDDLRERLEETPGTPFVALEEVLAIPGIEEQDWVGDGQRPGLRDLLTVWGDGKVNINTAPREVLELVPGVDTGAVDTMIDYFAGPDEERYTEDDERVQVLSDLTPLVGLTPEQIAPFTPYCKTESQFYRITGFATRRQGRLRVEYSAICQEREEGRRQTTLDIIQWKERVRGP
jgi:type II secretory pathway component PulK